MIAIRIVDNEVVVFVTRDCARVYLPVTYHGHEGRVITIPLPCDDEFSQLPTST